jgi:hypothetical protein
VKAAEVSFLLSTGERSKLRHRLPQSWPWPQFPRLQVCALTWKVTSVFEEQYKIACQIMNVFSIYQLD